ncbi:MAG: hypothetical protein QOF57_1742 [Frankiaceae bacterium]|nr:hypothetical protein [Frankiaceae bacterium]MDQ1726711.1 hypothetical protein [Frankiaceae bacterium]
MATLRLGRRGHHWFYTAMVALDPVTLVASVVYAAAAAATGGRLSWDPARAMVVCTKASPRLHGGGGTTVGCVYLTSAADVSEPVRWHESRHRDQWGVAGPLFAALYLAEVLRTKKDFTRNVWERWAGLEDGGYV